MRLSTILSKTVSSPTFDCYWDAFVDKIIDNTITFINISSLFVCVSLENIIDNVANYLELLIDCYRLIFYCYRLQFNWYRLLSDDIELMLLLAYRLYVALSQLVSSNSPCSPRMWMHRNEIPPPALHRPCTSDSSAETWNEKSKILVDVFKENF